MHDRETLDSMAVRHLAFVRYHGKHKDSAHGMEFMELGKGLGSLKPGTEDTGASASGEVPVLREFY